MWIRIVEVPLENYQDIQVSPNISFKDLSQICAAQFHINQEIFQIEFIQNCRIINSNQILNESDNRINIMMLKRLKNPTAQIPKTLICADPSKKPEKEECENIKQTSHFKKITEKINKYQGKLKLNLKDPKCKNVLDLITNPTTMKYLGQVMDNPESRNELINKYRTVWTNSNMFDAYKKLANGGIGSEDIMNNPESMNLIQDFAQALPGVAYNSHRDTKLENELARLREQFKSELDEINTKGLINDQEILQALKRFQGDVEKVIDYIIDTKMI